MIFEVKWGATSDKGLVRAHNEDAWLAGDTLFLVADGVGGHSAGDIASRAVVDALRPLANQQLTSTDLHKALEAARTQVTNLDRPGRQPGSTVVGVGLIEQYGVEYWMFFNIGDSRAYLLRDSELEQITVDHSRYQELKESGKAADESVGRNVITKAIGAGVRGPLLADQWLVPARAGDRVLLCSDGLTTEVSDQLIAATLLSHSEPKQAAEELVRSALIAGGHDNVTALVVDAVHVGVPGQIRQDLEEDTLSDATELIDLADTLPELKPAWFTASGREEVTK